MTDNLPALAEPDLVARIAEAHQHAETAARSMVEYAVEAGNLLLEAKRRCEHGAWLPWLEQHVTFSVRTAQAYMRIARHWGELENTQAAAHLSMSDALALLATPSLPALADGSRTIHIPETIEEATVRLTENFSELVSGVSEVCAHLAAVQRLMTPEQYTAWLRAEFHWDEQAIMRMRRAWQEGDTEAMVDRYLEIRFPDQ